MKKNYEKIIENLSEERILTPPDISEAFKKYIYNYLKEEYGFKGSQKKAWKLYKDLYNRTVDFVIKLPEGSDEYARQLTLFGLGNFEIVNVQDKMNERNGRVRPKFKIYPSRKIQEKVIKELYENKDGK